MEGIMAWGIEVLRAIQTIQAGWLDAVFKIITFTGNEEFYLLLLPIIYWCMDNRLGERLAYLFLISVAINTDLKDLFALPRPSPQEVRVVIAQSGYGLPSGHAQNSTVLWGYLATQVKSRAFSWIAVVLIIVVSFSRLYLGVHYPSDVLAGILIGLVLLVLYVWAMGRFGPRLTTQPLGVKIAVVVLFSSALLILHIADDTISAMATLMGLGVGIALEREYLGFKTAGTWWVRILRFVVGAIGLVLFYLGLKVISPGGSFFRAIRYLLVGLWTSFGAPWAFLKLRVAER